MKPPEQVFFLYLRVLTNRKSGMKLEQMANAHTILKFPSGETIGGTLYLAVRESAADKLMAYPSEKSIPEGAGERGIYFERDGELFSLSSNSITLIRDGDITLSGPYRPKDYLDRGEAFSLWGQEEM